LAKIPYPSWRHHRTENKRIVQNEDEDLALGDGWSDKSTAFDEPEVTTPERKPMQPDPDVVVFGGTSDPERVPVGGTSHQGHLPPPMKPDPPKKPTSPKRSRRKGGHAPR